MTAANGFASQGDVVIRCRQAADLAGATKMDRPEWIAVHLKSGEVYVTLTNNKRGATEPAGPDAANPRPENHFGHIVRWREKGGIAAATTFEWDIFALAGDPQNSNPDKQGNIRGDAYGCPDGLWFDPADRLWIQTDISTSVLNQGDFANLGSNQMLVADIRDGKTLFVNIQHPGETASERSDPANPTAVSAWPANQFAQAVGGRPRSAMIVITRPDGRPVAG